MMTRLMALLLVLVTLAIGVTVARATVHQQVSTCENQAYAEAKVAGDPRLSLEVAATPADRARGLMFRTSLPEDQGMLFVFENQTDVPFWMKNTLIPLSIAYIDRQGTIVDIQDMQPEVPGLPVATYPPARPYLYALEVNQGWYARHGVNVEDALAFCLPSS